MCKVYTYCYGEILLFVIIYYATKAAHNTYTSTHDVLEAILPGECGLTGFPFNSPSVYILFNTVPSCPFKTGEGMAVKEEEFRVWKVHCIRGNWCRVFVAGCPSCHQPVLKTSTGTCPFFNHQHTPEGRDVAPFCIHSEISVTTHNALDIYILIMFIVLQFDCMSCAYFSVLFTELW